MASPIILPNDLPSPSLDILATLSEWADKLKNAAGITVTDAQRQAIDNQTAADIAAAKGTSVDVARGVSEVNASIDYSRDNATGIGIDSIANSVKNAIPDLSNLNLPALPDAQTLAYVVIGIVVLIGVLLAVDLFD